MDCAQDTGLTHELKPALQQEEHVVASWQLRLRLLLQVWGLVA